MKNIYPATAEVMADILSPIVPGLKGDPGEALAAARGVEKWLASVGVAEKLVDIGVKAEDIDRLTDLAFETPGLAGLISVAPTDGTREAVRSIYADSLKQL